jgi:hypothetical protein
MFVIFLADVRRLKSLFRSRGRRFVVKTDVSRAANVMAVLILNICLAFTDEKIHIALEAGLFSFL